MASRSYVLQRAMLTGNDGLGESALSDEGTSVARREAPATRKKSRRLRHGTMVVLRSSSAAQEGREGMGRENRGRAPHAPQPRPVGIASLDLPRPTRVQQLP